MSSPTIHKSQDQTKLTSPTRAHERQPAGITHLHNDTVPTVGGDTLWASGYSAYEKLSPEFRKIIDGRHAIYRSAHSYLDRDDPNAGPKYIERSHPLDGAGQRDLVLKPLARKPFVIAGLIVATLLTLFVIPTVYEIFDGWRSALGARFRGRRAAPHGASPAPVPGD